MRAFFLLISLLVGLFVSSASFAQTTFPTQKGDMVKYTTMIEMPKAYISGIGMLWRKEDDVIYGSLFNEFGITAIDFSYNTKKEKIKLQNVLKAIDKWYIRKVLKKDLKQVLTHLEKGEFQYTNTKRNIKYSFTPLNSDSI